MAARSIPEALWLPSTHCSPAKKRSAFGMDFCMNSQPPLENAPGMSFVLMTATRRAGELLVEVEAGVLPGRFRQHELIDSLDAGELRQVAAAAFHSQRVVFGSVGIRELQVLAVEVELLPRDLHALRVHVLPFEPVLHQNRRQEEPGALVVIARGNQVGLERVVGVAVIVRGRGRRWKPAQRVDQVHLRAAEKQTAESAVVGAAHRGIKVVPGIEPPAQPPGRALLPVARERLERLTKRLEPVEGFERRRLVRRHLHRPDGAYRIEGGVLEAPIAGIRNDQCDGVEQRQASRRHQQNPPQEAHPGAGAAGAHGRIVGEQDVAEQVGEEEPLRHFAGDHRARRLGPAGLCAAHVEHRCGAAHPLQPVSAREAAPPQAPGSRWPARRRSRSPAETDPPEAGWGGTGRPETGPRRGAACAFRAETRRRPAACPAHARAPGNRAGGRRGNRTGC